MIRSGAATLSGAELLDLAGGFFKGRRRGFVLWVRDHADADLDGYARSAGLWPRPPVDGNPGIAIDHRLPDRPIPADVELRRVVDETDRRDYLKVVAAGYNIGDVPVEMAETVLFSLASLAVPEVAAFVAYRDGQPLSACMAYVSDGSAGLQWCATLPAARGAGLGKTTFAAACNAGFAMGAECATGQGSELGTPIWVRMGFQVVTRYRRYLARPATPWLPVDQGISDGGTL